MCAIIWAGIRPGQSSPKRLSQSFQFHRSHVRNPQLSALNLSRSLLPSNAMDQTRGSAQLCFSATCGTVNPFDKSAFRKFGSSAIFSKWFDTVLCITPNLFASLSWGITIRFIRNILRSRSNMLNRLQCNKNAG